MDIETFLINTADHLIHQTERCADRQGRCCYAGPGGNACAIGCHLPRELAERLDISFDGGGGWGTVVDVARQITADTVGGASEIRQACREAVLILPGISKMLGRDVQDIHDREPERTPRAKRDMLDRMIKLASRYGATDKCLDALRELKSNIQS